MSRTVRWIALLFALTLAFAAGNHASASCITNHNSELSVIDGQEVCAYTGDGCSACFSSGGRGPGSWDLCYYDWATGDLNCTYYM
jgi:hypothetical protein